MPGIGFNQMVFMPVLFSDHVICLTSTSTPISVLSEGKYTGSHTAFARAIVLNVLLPAAKRLTGAKGLVSFVRIGKVLKNVFSILFLWFETW